jgi:hypothetical protein
MLVSEKLLDGGELAIDLSGIGMGERGPEDLGLVLQLPEQGGEAIEAR